MSNPLSITKINIEQLFGFYNYQIPNKETDISKLLILYGDNGCGKTTVLKIIFYLLSTRDQSGFKTKLAQTKFKKISIKLENGIEIGASREDANEGSYTYYILKDGHPFKSVKLKATPEGSVNVRTQTKEDIAKYKSIINYLIDLKIHTFFLSDNRKIHSSLTTSLNEEERNERKTIDLYRDLDLRRKPVPDQYGQSTLGPALERLLSWIKNKTLAGSRIGEKNSQLIFSDIINNYINLSNAEYSVKTKIEIIKELDFIEKKIPSYVDLGLIDKFDTKTLRSSIKKATTEEQIKYLTTIISPFLEGINAKLKALEKVEKTVNLFISIVNDYFSNKKLSFNLSIGFILTQNNEKINFDWLSSGEKQLLILLINTIASSDDATVFIIDEPEISLNLKWQRKLIQTLLDFSSDKNMQFILATHSIELLTANRLNVSKLENINVGK